MPRRMFIAGNWKMNLAIDEAVALATDIARGATTGVDVAVAPPFPWLVPVRDALGDSSVLLGAQNCHWENSGAFTGEVSARMIAGTCDFILAGHSERRHVFHETDNDVARKLVAILDGGMTAILCVGETINERQSGGATTVVTRQLETALNAISENAASRITVAYEPVWAIGTGVAATSNDAQEMCSTVRSWLSARFGVDGEGVRILYGGSMSPANAAELLEQPDVDGGLIGGASLNPGSFLEIVAAAEAVSRM